MLEVMHVQHGTECQIHIRPAVCTVFARIQTILFLLSIVRAKHHLCKNYTSKSYLYPSYLLIQSNQPFHRHQSYQRVALPPAGTLIEMVVMIIIVVWCLVQIWLVMVVQATENLSSPAFKMVGLVVMVRKLVQRVIFYGLQRW